MCVRRIATVGLVDVLAARAGGAHRVGAHVALLDVDDDAVVDHRIDARIGERGVTPRVGIERRDAHQAMHAVLALEPAVGVAALDLHRGRLDAGALARRLFEIIDLVAVLLGPARVHAQQHLGPILALGAARAGLHFEESVVGVGLARQQRLKLAPRRLGLQPLERGLGLGDHLRIVLGLAELDHGQLVVELALDLADRAEPILERVALLHGALRFRAVVPEIGVFGLLVQLGEPRLRCIDVKDASSAARPTA